MRTQALLLAGCVLGCTSPAPRDSAPSPEGTATLEREAAPHPHGASLRWQQRKGEHGRVPDGAHYRATLEHQARLATVPEASTAPTNWTLLGPGNIGGRIRSILIDPTNPLRMWVGSVGGGIWRSNDGGGNWTMAPDLPAVLAVSCMTMHPQEPDTIWAGTGEECFFNQLIGSSNSAVQQGAGLFKSEDGGDTWTQVQGTFSAGWSSIARLAIDPNHPLIMLAATLSGIWRTTNGGNQWTQVTAVKTLDVKFDPNNSNNCVAGRTGGIAQYSTNGGLTWNSAPAFANGGRVELAYARNTPNMVYAAVRISGSLRVWRSTNGGQSYTQQTTSGVVTSLANYSGAIWVDPTNSARVLLGGLDVYRSTNSGVNFSKISNWSSYPNSAHADQHLFVEHPNFNGTSNNTVYFGNDGGIQRATNVFTVSQNSGWTNLANGLAITQYYGCAISPISSTVIGGAQDNGTSRGTAASGINGWTQPGGGDGGFCAADPGDPNYFYFQTQHLGLRRSSNGGSSSSPIVTGLNEPTSNFASFVLLDPNDSNRLYVAGAQLWRTNNAKGGTPLGWVSVKTAIPCVDEPPGPLPDHFEDNPPCNISTFAVARGDSNIMWVGHNNGELYRSTNALAGTPTWTRVDTGAPGLPNRWISRIAIDHFDPNVVTVSLMGFAIDNVWRTTNAGASWSPRMGTTPQVLPSVPVSCILQHRVLRERYYIATDLGLYYSEDDTQSWSPVPGGPSIVSMDELVWKNDRTLLVATHGRSLWTCDVEGSSITHIGMGCGAVGIPTILVSAPILGTAQSYALSGASPNRAASLLIASGNAAALPIGNCVLQPALPFLSLAIGTTDVTGAFITSIPIPQSPDMVGVMLTAQEFILVPGGPLLGIGELSNGVEMSLGF